MSAIRVLIHGRVQGVGYRAWTVATASSFGLKGWVRNRRDGTVEAVFSGEEEVILRMIDRCKDGPQMAMVDKIESFRFEEKIIDGKFAARETL